MDIIRSDRAFFLSLSRKDRRIEFGSMTIVRSTKTKRGTLISRLKRGYYANSRLDISLYPRNSIASRDSRRFLISSKRQSRNDDENKGPKVSRETRQTGRCVHQLRGQLNPAAVTSTFLIGRVRCRTINRAGARCR